MVGLAAGRSQLGREREPGGVARHWSDRCGTPGAAGVGFRRGLRTRARAIGTAEKSLTSRDRRQPIVGAAVAAFSNTGSRQRIGRVVGAWLFQTHRLHRHACAGMRQRRGFLVVLAGGVVPGQRCKGWLVRGGGARDAAWSAAGSSREPESG